MSSDSEDDDDNSNKSHDWSHDMSALQEIGEEVLEEWRSDNPKSPRDYPTVQWLVDNGYSHLRWILGEKHDWGTPEFFVLLTSAGGSEGYEWMIEDITTIELVNTYLDDRVECREWKDSTKRTQQARINHFLGRLSDCYGDGNFISIANDPTLKTEMYTSCKQVIKDLRDDLSSIGSAYQHTRAAHRFFLWLDRSDRIVYDPMEDIEDEFRWDFPSESTVLIADQIQRLWKVAETPEQRMLVIGYCIWGIRTQELPAVHIDQITLDEDGSYIEFNEADRKNGQGDVTIIYGLDTLADLIHKREQDPNWNGYLFPSSESGRDTLCSTQMRRRFKKLCRKAGVDVNGEVATPKHGRAFYYNCLAAAESDLLEEVNDFAAEQGATDVEAIRDHYLTDKTKRQYRRIFFRERIREILPDDSHTEYSHSTDRSFDDFK